MASKVVVNQRIQHLHKLAKSNKYTWDDLRHVALRMGITAPTAKKYLDEVKKRLEKEGLI